MKKHFLIPLAFTASLSLVHAAELQVLVEGINDKNGQLHIALYDREGFLHTPIVHATSPADKPMVVFPNLVPGSYAVSIFQDINGNGKMDKNLLGIPREPYGFSNDATGRMGPPGFDAAAIQLDKDDKSIVIKLR